MERKLGAICRAVAVRVAEMDKTKPEVKSDLTSVSTIRDQATSSKRGRLEHFTT